MRTKFFFYVKVKGIDFFVVLFTISVVIYVLVDEELFRKNRMKEKLKEK